MRRRANTCTRSALRLSGTARRARPARSVPGRGQADRSPAERSELPAAHPAERVAKAAWSATRKRVRL